MINDRYAGCDSAAKDIRVIWTVPGVAIGTKQIRVNILTRKRVTRK